MKEMTARPTVDSEVAARQRPGRRRCLGCGKMFNSAGAQNRICQACAGRETRDGL